MTRPAVPSVPEQARPHAFGAMDVDPPHHLGRGEVRLVSWVAGTRIWVLDGRLLVEPVATRFAPPGGFKIDTGGHEVGDTAWVRLTTPSPGGVSWHEIVPVPEPGLMPRIGSLVTRWLARVTNARASRGRSAAAEASAPDRS